MYFIPKYILCLFFLILVDYFMARAIEKSANDRKRKNLLVLSILSNFGLLFYFKYLNFFVANINFISTYVFNTEISTSNEILPIGLSFHTFQSVSYVVDVYRRRLPAEKHLGVYSSYVLFFPQMVAGPIERYNTLGSELNKRSLFKWSYLQKALPLVLIGFFYKMVIADNCGEYVNNTFADVSTKNHINVLIAIFLFCIQIYSDFFGYSLIAQGSAHLFNIKLIDNFRFPFYSENIVTFWKKWHISLTSWFRDYVYIPMGGNRGSVSRHYLNIVVIFGLSGLWHGAGYNFIIWGLLHAFFYILSIYFSKTLRLKFPIFISYILNFVLISFIFVFFRVGDFSESIGIFQNLIPENSTGIYVPLNCYLCLNLIFVFSLEYFVKEKSNYESFFLQENSILKAGILIYTTFAILVFSGVDNLPFIYFQF